MTGTHKELPGLAEKVLENMAIDLYAKDGFLLAIYSDPAEAWAADREEVRERYRAQVEARILAAYAKSR